MPKFSGLLFDRLGTCACGGVLAAEMSSLPERLAEGVRDFFAENELWLAGVLARGRSSGELKFSGTAERTAQAIFCQLRGCVNVSMDLQR